MLLLPRSPPSHRRLGKPTVPPSLQCCKPQLGKQRKGPALRETGSPALTLRMVPGMWALPGTALHGFVKPCRD